MISFPILRSSNLTLESDAPPRELTQAEELESYRRLCEELTQFIEKSLEGVYITDGTGTPILDEVGEIRVNVLCIDSNYPERMFY